MPSIASSPSDDFAHRLHDTGWGLLLMLTGLVWLVPPGAIPAGTWLFGVAAILLGINAIRYVAHVGVSAFSVTVTSAHNVSKIWSLVKSTPGWRTSISSKSVPLGDKGTGLPSVVS